MPIAALNEPEVLQVFLDWRDKVATTSGLPEAEHRLSQISAMLSWARERGKISANHLKGRKRLYHVDRRENIYTQKDIDAFMAVASIEMKQAMTLGLHTGQREGDLLHLPWSAYDGTTIRLKQSKTGKPVEIPCTVELRQMLDGMERRAVTILTTATGRPWKRRHFSDCWTQTMKKAGIEGLTFHDLRGTFVTRAAERDCTVQETAAITGQSLATVDRYYLARTPELARNAIAKLENGNRTNSVNRAVNRESTRTNANEKK